MSARTSFPWSNKARTRLDPRRPVAPRTSTRIDIRVKGVWGMVYRNRIAMPLLHYPYPFTSYPLLHLVRVLIDHHMRIGISVEHDIGARCIRQGWKLRLRGTKWPHDHPVRWLFHKFRAGLLLHQNLSAFFPMIATPCHVRHPRDSIIRFVLLVDQRIDPLS